MPNCKNVGWDIIKFLDPTGVTSWKDASKAVTKAIKDPGIVNTGDAALETLGALPIIGKVGKAGKVIKLVDKALGKYKPLKITKALLKIPGKTIQKPIEKGISIVTKSPVVQSAIKLNNAKVKSRYTNSVLDLETDLLDKKLSKGAAYYFAQNSGGDASPFALLGSIIRQKEGKEYTGMVSLNSNSSSDSFIRNGTQNPIKQALYGNGGFEKYNKPMKLDGKQLTNTYKAVLIPVDTLYLTKQQRDSLSNKLLRLNSEKIRENMGYNDKPFLDSYHFNLSFNNKNFARASDIWDQNSMLGEFMNRATVSNSAFPNAGIPTFVQEIPIKIVKNNDNFKLIKQIESKD